MQLNLDQVSIHIQTKQIVHDINLHVPDKMIVGLVGPNGSGKSTLLRSVYRMMRPIAGYIRMDKTDIWKTSARQVARHISAVVQESPSDFDFTVLEVVQMGRTPHKHFLEIDTHKDSTIVHDALLQVGMDDFSSRIYKTLSGGEKQRVLIARALAQQPKILILDEPTNHLDIQHQLDILELISTLDVTTLIVLHDLNLAMKYCHLLYMLSNGKVVASGMPDVVLTRDRIQTIFQVDAVHVRHPITDTIQLLFSPLTKD